MFDKDSFIRLMYSVLVSAVITMLVLLTTYSEAVFFILKGMLAGTIIWFLGELLFPFCEKLYPKSILAGYIVLSLLIFCGTIGFAYLLGLRSLVVLIKICILAEICGVGITILYRNKYTKLLNKKLESNRNKFE
ncbi:MAG: hypothetical protein ABF289_04435 [Clostridiales bacterium]